MMSVLGPEKKYVLGREWVTAEDVCLGATAEDVCRGAGVGDEGPLKMYVLGREWVMRDLLRIYFGFGLGFGFLQDLRT